MWLCRFLVNKKKNCPIRPTVTFNKMNLIYTAETKFLGVYITEKLKWNTHVQSLENKLSKVSFMIKSIKENMSPFVICNIYFSKSQSLLFTYLLTPCSRVLLEKLTSFQLVKKFPAFYGTRRFITAFTSACHLL